MLIRVLLPNGEGRKGRVATSNFQCASVGSFGGVTEGIFNADCLAVSLLQAIRRRYSDLAPDGES